MRRSLSTQVYIGQIHFLFDKELYHFVASSLDSVVEGSLAIQVHNVWVSSQVNEL